MAEKVGEIYLEIGVVMGAFLRAIAEARTKGEQLETSFKKSSKTIAESFKAVENRAVIFGNSVDVLAQKQSVLKSKLEELISKGVNPTNAGLQKLKNQYDEISNKIASRDAFKKMGDDAKAAALAAEKAMAQLGQSLIATGKNLTMLLTVPIIGLGAAFLKTSASMEQASISFEVLLGNAELAKEMLSDIEKFAARTPFAFPDLAESAQMMLNFGIASSDIMGNLKMLGDVSGGSAEKLKSLSLVFSQVSAAGKLQGGDLLQLINAGFNPLLEISQKTGRSMGDLRADMEKGAISAKMVKDAFISVTSEGGRFYGMMDKQSQSLSGLMSTLLDNVAALGRDIISVVLPAVKEFVDWAGKLAASFSNLSEETKKKIVFYGALTAAIGPVLMIVGKLIAAYRVFIVILGAVKAGIALQTVATGASTGAFLANRAAIAVTTIAMKALNLVMRLNPIVLVVTAAIALFGALYGLTRRTKEQTEAEKAAAETKRLLKMRMDEIRETSQKQLELTDSYVEGLKRDGMQETTIIATLKEKNKELDQERRHMRSRGPEAIKSLNDMIGANNRHIEALKKSQQQQRTNDKQAASKEWLSARQAALDKWTKYNEEFGKNAVQMVKLQHSREQKELDEAVRRGLITKEIYAESSKNIATKLEQDITKINEDEIKKRNDAILRGAQYSAQMANELGAVYSMYNQNQIMEIDNETKKKLDSVQTKYDAEKATIEATETNAKIRAKKLEALDERRAREEKKINEKAEKDKRKIQIEGAKMAKKIAIYDTLIATPIAAMSAFKAMAGIPYIGPGLGIAAAAAATTMGLAKIALIASQPLPVAAQGIYAETPYIGGEAGPEIAFPLASAQGKKAMDLMSTSLINNIAARQAQPAKPPEAAPQMQFSKVVPNQRMPWSEIFQASQNGELYIANRAVVAE